MNPLQDLLPPKVRQILYALLFVTLLVFGAIQAASAEGKVDWFKAIGTIISSLIPVSRAATSGCTPF